jgi:hypothetical protein
VYLGRRALRDRFRGVAAHATVSVDGLEPSPILRTRPFALPDAAAPRVLGVEDRDGLWRIVAEHHGYRRAGVLHRREVRWERARGRVTVIDTLLGAGAHDVAVSFPLASAGAKVALAPDGRDDKLAQLRIDPGMTSPSYGEVRPAPVARRAGRVELPATLTTVLTRK